MRDSFIFYRSFFETFTKLPREERLDLFEAVCNYALNDSDPADMSGVGDAIFTLLKPQLDANTRKYENGLKGGRPSGDKKPNGNQKETKEKPNGNQSKSKPKRNDNVNDNDNVNVNENVNDNVNENEKENVNAPVPVDSSSPSSVIKYLNQKVGSSYRTDTETIQLITDLIGMGYTEHDLRVVIDKKTADWLDDPKMRQYLKPSTLFGPRFPEYLSAPEPIQAKEERSRSDTREKLIKERTKQMAELNKLHVKILESSDPDSARALYDQEAIAQDRIDAINKRLEAMG